jgi:predicted aspartyl protease
VLSPVGGTTARVIATVGAPSGAVEGDDDNPLIWIPTTVVACEGKPCGKPLGNMLIDTGSQSMLLDHRVVERLALPTKAATIPRTFKMASGQVLTGGTEVVSMTVVLNGANGEDSPEMAAVAYVVDISPIDMICSIGWLRLRELSVVPHKHCVQTDEGVMYGGKLIEDPADGPQLANAVCYEACLCGDRDCDECGSLFAPRPSGLTSSVRQSPSSAAADPKESWSGLGHTD